MAWAKLKAHHEAHLRGSMSRGRVVLFTGAGFSLDARSMAGLRLPTTDDLTDELWQIVFDDERDDSSLGDVYSVGVNRCPKEVRAILDRRLRVDPTTLPQIYRLWYSASWHRIYTLNVDDLDVAVSVAFRLPRPVNSISALSSDDFLSTGLDSVHLNGKLDDFPQITFSEEQYGSRTAKTDVWYQHLMTDLLTKPIVFVGSTLREPTLWHYVALLGRKGAQTKEIRPRSYIVSKELSLARRAKLEQYNVVWIQATHQEFADSFLKNCRNEIDQGLLKLSSQSESIRKGFGDVSDLRLETDDRLADFLIGKEPTWADITEGFAVEREFEEAAFKDSLGEDVRIVTVTGTAGCGKSTTLKRLALKYEARSDTVLWLDKWTEVSPATLRKQIETIQPGALFIDDVDRFRDFAPKFLKQVQSTAPACVIFCGIRSSKYESLLFADRLEGTGHHVVRVPHLTDQDIALLIDALVRSRRLGILAGRTHKQRVSALKNQAGRQLLVALYQATTGRRFEEIIESECSGLPRELIEPYAVTSIATNFHTYVTLDEILSAINDHSNEGLNRVRRLQNMHLLTPDHTKQIRVRHRRIAELVVEYLKREGLLEGPLSGLLFVIASQVRPGLPKRSRTMKLLVMLLNHDNLIRLLADDAHKIRRVYETVEGLLDMDPHYWLQRGRFEAESGELRSARLFVDQARSLNPDDLFVRTGWADAIMRYATAKPDSSSSAELFEEARDELHDAIALHGKISPYPFGVLAQRVLAWLDVAVLTASERNSLLVDVEHAVVEGLGLHPKNEHLPRLFEMIRRARLMEKVGPHLVGMDA